MGSAKRQGVSRHRLCDHGSRADVASLADLNGRNQRGVASHERLLTNACAMLLHAIVIASDGARTDVGLFTDFRVAQVRQVTRFGPRAKLRILEFHEISD